MMNTFEHNKNLFKSINILIYLKKHDIMLQEIQNK
jgi:hypothetical protein